MNVVDLLFLFRSSKESPAVPAALPGLNSSGTRTMHHYTSLGLNSQAGRGVGRGVGGRLGGWLCWQGRAVPCGQMAADAAAGFCRTAAAVVVAATVLVAVVEGQYVLGPPVGLQGRDGGHVLGELRLPPH